MGEEEKEEIMEEEEGESGAAEAVPSAGAGPSKIIKILLYVAGGVLLIILVTGISYVVSKNVQEGAYEKRQDIVSAPPPPPLKSFALEPFSKTTADDEPHFIKMTISLAYEDNPLLASELGSRKDQIQHMVNILLQGKKFEELNSVRGALDLSEDIKAHINVILINGKIREIYFKEFLVN